MERKREQEKANERRRRTKNLVEKSKVDLPTILTKYPSTAALPKDGNNPKKVTVIETPLACVGFLATPILPNSPNGVCLRRQENCLTGAVACGKTIPVETEQDDVLGYCRAWKIENAEQFWKRWIAHPHPRIRMDIFGELASYQSREAYTLEQQVNWVVNMARKVERPLLFEGHGSKVFFFLLFFLDAASWVVCLDI